VPAVNINAESEANDTSVISQTTCLMRTVIALLPSKTAIPNR